MDSMGTGFPPKAVDRRRAHSDNERPSPVAARPPTRAERKHPGVGSLLSGAAVVSILAAALFPARAPATDSRLEALNAAVRSARDERTLQALPDPSWAQYMVWGDHNQDELVWLSAAVKDAQLDLTSTFHVGRREQLPRNDPGIRRLLLIDAKTKFAGKNPDQARHVLRDLLDRAVPDRSPELAEALFLFVTLERRALVESNPSARASAMVERMTGFFRQAEPQALHPDSVELADTPEQATEQEWMRTFRALKAYLNDRPEWGPTLALEYARALDMSWESFDDFYMTVHAFNVVNGLLALVPRFHSADALWIAPWGTLYLGLFCSRLQEYDRAEGYFEKGIDLFATIVKANVPVDDPRVATRADLAILQHPDTLYPALRPDPTTVKSGNLLVKWTYLMEAQERFGDLRPGQRGWDRPEGKAIAANGLPTAVGYETLYDEVSADSMSSTGQLRRMGSVQVTEVTPPKRTYVWKRPDGKVVRRDFEIYGDKTVAGVTPTHARDATDWRDGLDQTRYDFQQAQDQSVALVNLPPPKETVETFHQVRAASFRRAGGDNDNFVVGLSSSSPGEPWFKGTTAEFSLLDQNLYPVEKSKASAFLDDHSRHRLRDGRDLYLSEISASAIPPGLYRWQVSLRSGDKILQRYVSSESQRISIPSYGRRNLEISDVRFQIPEEVTGPDGKETVDYLWSPFDEILVREPAAHGLPSDSASGGAPAAASDSSSRRTPAASSGQGSGGSSHDSGAQFNFMVEVYNLRATRQAGASYRTHYAIFPRGAYDEQVKPRLEAQAGDRAAAREERRPEDQEEEASSWLADLASAAVAQDVTGPRFCQTVEVGEFTVPPHAVPSPGAASVMVEERSIDYGERHLAVTVDVNGLRSAAYVLLMEVQDLRSGAVAWRSVPFTLRNAGR